MAKALRFEPQGSPGYAGSFWFDDLDLRVQSEPWILASELVQALRDFGPFPQGLINIQKGGAGQLDYVQVTLPRPGNHVTIIHRADRLDLVWLAPPESQESAARVVSALVEKQWSSKPVDVKPASASVDGHGRVEGGAASFLQRLVGSVPDLGPYAGPGLRLHYGPDGPRTSSRLLLELSSSVPDGLYLRMDSDWALSGLAVRDLVQLVVDYQGRVLTGLGLKTENIEEVDSG